MSEPVRPPPLPARPSQRPSAPPQLPPRPKPLPPPRRETSLSVAPAVHPGISNDALYTLLRRWNKQIDHLRVGEVQPGRLDLSPSPDEVFSPEKLRSNVERVYISVIRNLIVFAKEIVILRSWSEPIRTASFCSAYFIAWQSPIGVGPVFFGALAGLVLFPAFRTFLFPPRPPPRPLPPSPLPDGTELPDPFESDELTPGEKDELEARQFAQEFADLASAPFENDRRQAPSMGEIIEAAAGPDGNLDSLGAEVEEEDGVALGEDAVSPTAGAKDETKKVKRLAKYGLPIQRTLGDLADAWERWANVLSPTAPFATDPPRIKVALHILPIVLAFLILPSAFIFSTITFATGFLFFGDPVLQLIVPAIDAMVKTDWREAMQLRYSMLNGVPSNAQLTIRLLRDAEAAGTPLPPPPPLVVPTPKQRPAPSRKATTASMNTIASDVQDPSTGELVETELIDDTASIASTTSSGQPKVSGKAKFATFVRGAAKLGEQGAGYVSGQKQFNWEKLSRMAVDKIKVATGSELPEHFMSVVPVSFLDNDRSHSTFYAHRHGAPGHLLLHSPNEFASTSWVLEFVRVTKEIVPPPADPSIPAPPPLPTRSSNISIAVAEITALRRTAGLGWKGRLAAGWVMGSQSSVGDGIEVVWGPGPEDRTKFSAIVRRDELFNRLASVGPQTFWHL